MPFLLKSSFTNSFGPDINVGTKTIRKTALQQKWH